MREAAAGARCGQEPREEGAPLCCVVALSLAGWLTRGPRQGVNAASHARAYGHEAVVPLLGEEM